MPHEEHLRHMPLEECPAEAGWVEAYAMKIPPYWPADPQFWFVYVEVQFAARGITAQCTMYHHSVSSLSPEIAMEIRELLLQPPEHSLYDILKWKLIECTAASWQRRLQELFTEEELGDQMPTQLLHRMQPLLGDKTGTTDGLIIKDSLCSGCHRMYGWFWCL